MKKTGLAILALAVCMMMIAPAGMSGKPQPEPYVEPTGKLATTSGKELLMNGNGYVRLFDWDTTSNKFVHKWSGITGFTHPSGCFLGDIDKDGDREVIATGGIQTMGKGKTFTMSYKWFIWQYDDQSDSPSYSFYPGFTPDNPMKQGEVNGDGTKELVAGDHIMTWDSTKSPPLQDIAHLGVGYTSVTIADADNDQKNEILIGMADPDYGHAIVVKYSEETGSFSTVGDLGPANTRAQINEVSVGDVDGDYENEIFGCGYNCNEYIWEHQSDGSYKQIFEIKESISSRCDFDTSIADFDGCGANEIAFTEQYQVHPPTSEFHLIIYKYDSVEATWYKQGTYENCPWSKSCWMYPVELDADGESELVVAWTVWDWDGSAMVKVQDLSSLAGSYVCVA